MKGGKEHPGRDVPSPFFAVPALPGRGSHKNFTHFFSPGGPGI